ncbi:HtaA domain-containing protein [Conexibacter woesei]|uniref:Htaa domain protein n=1 Tax=Conexibacter woesei (strain DSM 14684 / CCUG 47730 / CIP 108061 / JCM 11494 / NBRC 100937 / ID131577) TaxID=469383 RepID=D3F8E6_CONWI|nr:HtaA domain-containing protein [Conexibacter woesei]ADB49016.1 Htaa domain protein [Conexibacter woesei DSM 14684]
MLSRRTPRPRTARSALAACFFALTLALAFATAAPTRAAAAEPIQITDGDGLLWGLKQSWRTYAGIGTWSGGVEHVGGVDGYRWPFRSGTYDPDTHRAELRFGGSVRWIAHAGALDLTLSDPRLYIDGDDGRIVAKVVSKSESTGELEDYGEIAMVDVAVRGDALTVAAGKTTWNGLTTTLTADGRTAFSGNYPTGTRMDPVTTTYTGPGGVPRATGDDFAVEDAIAWSAVTRVTPDPTRNAYGFHEDTLNELVHTPVGGSAGLVALDPDTLEPVGTPLGSNPSSMFENYPGSTSAPRTGTVFDAGGGTIYAFTWDGSTQSYRQERLPGDFWADAIHFDVPRSRLIAVRSGELVTWRRVGGVWTQRPYTLAGVPFTTDSRAAIAADSTNELVVTSAGNRPILLQLSGTTATASFLPGDYSDPGAQQPEFDKPSGVTAAPGGGFDLTNYRGQVYQTRRDRYGALQPPAPPLEHGLGQVLATTSDAVLGTSIVADFALSTLGFVEDGRIAGTLRLDEQIGAGVISPIGIAAGPDGSLYVNGSGTQTKFERRGYTPRVTTQPQDAVVSLAAGVAGGSATFTAAGSARAWSGTEATPAIRWQTRAGGSGRFTDIAGATGASVTLDAAADDNGRQVRAVFTNANGEVGSRAATLTVNTAATIAVQPSDVAVSAGQAAEIKVMPVGNPAPQIQWQMKTGPFWADVDAESGDFDVDGGFLRVPSATATMDGTQFRARLRNRITPGSEAWSTVFTRAVTLNVTAPVTTPRTFGGGHVDWGFANRWRCYVVGNVGRGGIVPRDGAAQVPGTLATGNLCNGRGAGSEIIRFGVRGGSYDPANGGLELRLRGSVRFWGHDYHVPGSTRPQLDTTFSNLRLVAEGTRGTLYADVVGATMEAPAAVARRNVPLVSITLPDGPVARQSGLDWSGLETTLTAEGAAVFGSYPAGELFDPIAVAADYGTPEPEPRPQPRPEPQPAPRPSPQPPPRAPARATVVAGKNAVALKRAQRVVTIARLRCPAGRACAVVVPKRVALRVAGRRHFAAVVAPRRIAGGRAATVRVRLTRTTAARLAGRRAAVRVRVKVTAPGSGATVKVVMVMVRGAPASGR